MVFRYKDVDYAVDIIRKDNKNTYVRVKEERVVVTTGYFTSDRKIKGLLDENQKAIGKMIERARVVRSQRKDLFLLFGKYYQIEYGDYDHQITVEDGHIWVVSEEILVKWLEQYIHTTFYHHLKDWYERFEEDIPDPNLKIRKMKTRWGVCNTRNHNVTLNFELFRYDMECLDYVIVHELSHFVVQNHSKDFWRVVEKYCPNYKEIRKKLRS